MVRAKSAYAEYRQNGGAPVRMDGVIREKSHWIWVLLSVLVIAAFVAVIFYPRQVVALVQSLF